jgi:hypothetical protein
MIILHRPPRNLFTKPGIAQSDDVEICYESLQAMLRLLKSYSRFYKYPALPLDFVHTLSVTAGTILMKRFLENAPTEDLGISKSMEVVIDAMDKIKYTWPCVVEIRESIIQAMETKPADQQPDQQLRDPVLDFGFLADFGTGAGGSAMEGDTEDLQISNTDLESLLNSDFLSEQAQWDGSSEQLPFGFENAF